MGKNIFIKDVDLKTTFDGDCSDYICLCPISVGQSYSEGDVLEKTLAKISDCFGAIIVIVADTLQRHTILANNPSMEESVAFSNALQNGDEWLKNNEGILSKFEDKILAVIRWEDILSVSTVADRKSILRQAYDEGKNLSKDDQLKHTYNRFETAIKYFHFKKNKGQPFDINSHFSQQTLSYLIEEASALHVLHNIGVLFGVADMYVRFHAYPAKLNPALQMEMELINNNSVDNQFFHVEIELKQGSNKRSLSENPDKQNVANYTDELLCLKKEIYNLHTRICYNEYLMNVLFQNSQNENSKFGFFYSNKKDFQSKQGSLDCVTNFHNSIL